VKFLFLEPFFGGSHRDFAEGLISHSRHSIDLATLPARFWKWRMRGAALYFSQTVDAPDAYHGLITTDLMSLSDLKSIWGSSCPPALVYFHENQLTYPLAPGERMDMQFGFTDITTALSADRVLFNSRTHFGEFFSALPGFIGKMPEYRPRWVAEAIRDKSDVLYPGCRFPAKLGSRPLQSDLSPLIVWNHRWEFDKSPEAFFAALDALIAKGLDFRLALLGENFQMMPKPFLAAKERYGGRIVQYGYEASPAKYRQWLEKGDVIVSTANQENFGISVVEAVRHGCLPLLPRRLSYPEIMPEQFHPDILYADTTDLVEKLACILSDLAAYDGIRLALSEAMGKYAWESTIDRYDAVLEDLAHAAGT